MLSGGLRLLLALAAPLLGAALVHELRRSRAIPVMAAASIAACAALSATVLPSVLGGGSLERSFGGAIPGVELTVRGDSASVAVILVACLAALIAIPRQGRDGERLAGLLLCLAGTVAVAVSGNLVLIAGAVEIIAAGTMLLSGRRGPGSRSAAVVAALIGAAGLALTAAAAQLVAAAGTSDLAFVPQGSIGGALAIPWALAGAALLISPALLGGGTSPARDWAATGALPAGFLVLLRLQESAGDQLPGNAAVTLAVLGVAVAGTAGYAAWRAVGLAAAGRSGLAALLGVLVSLYGGPLATNGTVFAGLFLAIELALIAAPSWTRRPSGFSAASCALVALPGGATFAVVAVGLGSVAHRGAAAFPQLLVLAAALTASAIAIARALATQPRIWRPVLPGALLAAAAGLAGGLFPGLAMRVIAPPFAGGATPVDLDAGTLEAPGGGFAGGYFSVAAAILLAAAAAALVVAGDEPISAAVSQVRASPAPALRPLLRLRRRTAPVVRRAAADLRRLDRWLESQPQAPLLVAAAAVAVVLFH